MNLQMYILYLHFQLSFHGRFWAIKLGGFSFHPKSKSRDFYYSGISHGKINQLMSVSSIPDVPP